MNIAMSVGSIVTAATLVPTSPLKAIPFRNDDRIIRLAEQLRAAHQRYLDYEGSTTPAKILRRWKDKNPKPAIRHFEVAQVQGTFPRSILYGSSDDKEYTRACDAANADMNAAIQEHGVALSAWRSRYDRACEQAGLIAAQAVEARLLAAVQRLEDEVLELQVTTFEELKAKALCMNIDDKIQKSILDDVWDLANLSNVAA